VDQPLANRQPTLVSFGTLAQTQLKGGTFPGIQWFEEASHQTPSSVMASKNTPLPTWAVKQQKGKKTAKSSKRSVTRSNSIEPFSFSSSKSMFASTDAPRRKQYSAEERIQVAKTREVGACITCKISKIKVGENGLRMEQARLISMASVAFFLV
jgi:hypothetical protein